MPSFDASYILINPGNFSMFYTAQNSRIYTALRNNSLLKFTDSKTGQKLKYLFREGGVFTVTQNNILNFAENDLMHDI